MTSHTDYTYFLFGQAKDQPIISFFAGIIGKTVYGPADQIIVPSKKSLNFSFLDSVKDRLNVVPNGIEISKYQKKLTVDEKTGNSKRIKDQQ